MRALRPSPVPWDGVSLGDQRHDIGALGFGDADPLGLVKIGAVSMTVCTRGDTTEIP
jgi:hypothetical protein